MEVTDTIPDKWSELTFEITSSTKPEVKSEVEDLADDNYPNLHCNLEIKKEEDDWVTSDKSENLKVNSTSSITTMVWRTEYEDVNLFDPSLDKIIISPEGAHSMLFCYYKGFKYKDCNDTAINTVKWKCCESPMCNAVLEWRQAGDRPDRTICNVTQHTCNQVGSAPKKQRKEVKTMPERMVKFDGYIYHLNVRNIKLTNCSEIFKYKCCRSNQCQAAVRTYYNMERFLIVGKHTCDLNVKKKFKSKTFELWNSPKKIKSGLEPVSLTPVKIINHVPSNFQSIPVEEQTNFEIITLPVAKYMDYIKFRGYVHHKKTNLSLGSQGVVSYICQKYIQCMCPGSFLLKGDRIIQYKDHYCEGLKSLERLNLDLNDSNKLFIYYNINNRCAELCYKGLTYQQRRKQRRIGIRWACSNGTCGAFLILQNERVREPINHMCAFDKEAVESHLIPKSVKGKYVKVSIKNQLSCNFENVPVEEQTKYTEVKPDNMIYTQERDSLPGIKFKGFLYQKHEQLVSSDGSNTYVCLKYSKCSGSIKVKHNQVLGYIDHTCKETVSKESPTFNPDDRDTLVIYNNEAKTCLELFYRGFTYSKDWGVFPCESLWICTKKDGFKCPAYLRLTEDELALESGDHICNNKQSMEQEEKLKPLDPDFYTQVIDDLIKCENSCITNVKEQERQNQEENDLNFL